MYEYSSMYECMNTDDLSNWTDDFMQVSFDANSLFMLGTVLSW